MPEIYYLCWMINGISSAVSFLTIVSKAEQATLPFFLTSINYVRKVHNPHGNIFLIHPSSKYWYVMFLVTLRFLFTIIILWKVSILIPSESSAKNKYIKAVR